MNVDPESPNEIASLRRRLAVQTATTRVLAERTSLGDAVPNLLAEIGAELHWVVGEFWEPDESGSVLRRSAAWHSGDAGARAFVDECEGLTFTRGVGLPGRVWASGTPHAIEKLPEALNFPRMPLAARHGMMSALAFPVLVGNEFFGVLEFFTPLQEVADANLLATMADVGLQLGQFVRRTRSEAARLESESRFRIFAETASDATFTITENSTITYVNPAVERIFGYHPAELLGRSLTVIIPERMRSAHEGGIRRYTETGKRNIPWTGVVLPGLHKDGHEVPLEISFGEYSREGHRYFTGIARDITERVRHEQESRENAQRLAQVITELEARTDEAEAASSAKSQFLANMSHELRTPINAIVGYGELLQMGLAGPLAATQAEYLERIRISAQHLLVLITDVLDLAKIEAGHMTVSEKVAPIAQDVQAALAVIAPAAEANSLTISNGGECANDARYLGDSGRVRQILVNLLSNAVKFTEPGGSIAINCGFAKRTGDRNAQECLFVSVADTGIGIPAEQLSAIFEPFVQASTGTTRTHGGTGLGLSISRQLARLMGGAITAESQPGKGSKFTLWLRSARAHGRG